MARRREPSWIDGEAGSWLIFGIAIGGLALYAGLRKLTSSPVATSGFAGMRPVGCMPCQEAARRGY